MTSVIDIRLTVGPLPLSQTLQGLNVGAFLDARDDAPSASQLDALKVSGAIVSPLDCEVGWTFTAILGFTQHGVYFVAAVRVNRVSVLLTDVEGAELTRQTGVDLPAVVVTDLRSAAILASKNVCGLSAEKLKTMAVTGTNGKITTSFLMRAAFGIEFANPAICGTVETHIGGLRFRLDQTTAEPPVVEQLPAITLEGGLGTAVVETNSHALSLGWVDGIVFDVVALTDLQHDHLNHYGEIEGHYATKKMFFTPARSKRGVICVDGERGQRLAKETSAPITTAAALSKEEADWTVRDVHPGQGLGKIIFELVDLEGTVHPVAMSALGEVNAQNTAVTIVAALGLGYGTDEMIATLEGAEQIPRRMQKINPEPRNQSLVIVGYAYTPEAFEWTLRSTGDLIVDKLAVVFGMDGDRDVSKCEIIAGTVAREMDVLWVTDENLRIEDPQSIRDYLMRGIKSVRLDLNGVMGVTSCRRDAVRKTILVAQPGDTVVITGKGSRWYQDIEGVKHEYDDVPVAHEVLTYDLRSHV